MSAESQESQKQEESTERVEELTQEELLGWFEFVCWTALLLTPLLYYVHGPAVSREQFIMRSLVVAVSLIGGLTLTLRRRWSARKRPGSQVAK